MRRPRRWSRAWSAPWTSCRSEAARADEDLEFSLEWWDVVRELLLDQEQGPLQVSFDRDQALRARAQPPVAWLPAQLSLDPNCRSAAGVALIGAALVGAKVRVLPGTPEGEVPRLVRTRAAADQRGLVVEEVGGLRRSEDLRQSQIAHIGPARWEYGALSGLTSIAGAPITADPAALRRGEGLLCTTARAFKGLGADAVILNEWSSAVWRGRVGRSGVAR